MVCRSVYTFPEVFHGAATNNVGGAWDGAAVPHSSLGNKTPASRVPIATYRLQPQPEVLDVPQVEGLGHEPTLFDLL